MNVRVLELITIGVIANLRRSVDNAVTISLHNISQSLQELRQTVALGYHHDTITGKRLQNL